MGKRDRICSYCREKYQYCPTCGNDRIKPTWMSEFCSESCKDLWDIATRFNMDLMSKAEAKEAIEKLDLKEKSVYVECVQRDLENILSEPKSKVEPQPFKASKQKSQEVVKTIE